jgi:flagellar basal-body rod protein FlgB
VFDDLTTTALQVAVAGLSARRHAIADNVANLNTPNYLAKRVSFEASLRSAIADGDPAAARVSTQTSLEPTGLNGNNVNLDDETVSITDTGLRYQTAIEALTAKFQLLKTAIGNG